MFWWLVVSGFPQRFQLFSHQFGTGCCRQMSQCRWAICLCGRSLRTTKVTRCSLIFNGSLGKGSFRKWLPLNLPQLRVGRYFPLVKHRAGVVPDFVTITDSQPRRTGCCDNMLAIWTPGEVGGVWSLRFRYLYKDSVVRWSKVNNSKVNILAPIIPHLFVLFYIPDFHLTSQIPKSSQNQDVTLWTWNKIKRIYEGPELNM